MKKGKKLLEKARTEMLKKRPDVNLALELLTHAANKGNSEALYAIGTWYLHGKEEVIAIDPAVAVDYFLKSIEGNYCDAYYDLAICYEKGVGVKKNTKKAFECYLNAALLGVDQALYEVGRCYYHGIGIERNKRIAEIWLTQAREKGIED